MFYDLIFLGVVILTLVLGYRNGAAKSLLSLAAFFGSVILAIFLSRPLATLIYNTFIKANIESKISDFIVESPAGALVFEGAEFFASLPAMFSAALGRLGIEQNLLNGADNLPQSMDDATAVLAGKISPVIIGVMAVILCILLFIILRLLLGLIAKGVAKVFKLPLLRFPDAILGSVFGLFNGALIVVAFCVLLNLLSPLLSQPLDFLYSSMSESKIASFIWEGKLLVLIDKIIYSV